VLRSGSHNLQSDQCDPLAQYITYVCWQVNPLVGHQQIPPDDTKYTPKQTRKQSDGINGMN